jgi:hypothetical protein
VSFEFSGVSGIGISFDAEMRIVFIGFVLCSVGLVKFF